MSDSTFLLKVKADIRKANNRIRKIKPKNFLMFLIISSLLYLIYTQIVRELRWIEMFS